MIRLADWKRMTLVERREYEWLARRTKRVLLACGLTALVLFVITAVALTLHSKGVI